ncbi:MAG TPA: hypothetical protein P5136_00125 [Methanofastidiosum sp.]|nr:hypothetical protein [Methanofastidiosum sp.]
MGLNNSEIVNFIKEQAKILSEVSDKSHSSKAIKESILSFLKSIISLEDYSSLQLEFKKQKDDIRIEAKNLFSYLLLHGIYTPANSLIGLTEYKDKETGISYGYDEMNGGYWYGPRRTGWTIIRGINLK